MNLQGKQLTFKCLHVPRSCINTWTHS